jgi:hypothetical protein
LPCGTRLAMSTLLMAISLLCGITFLVCRTTLPPLLQICLPTERPKL